MNKNKVGFEDFYIRSCDASKLYWITNKVDDKDDGKDYSFIDNKKDSLQKINKKIYRCKLPISLELLYMQELAPLEFRIDDYQNYYTDMVFNVTFDYPYKEPDTYKKGVKEGEIKTKVFIKKDKRSKVKYASETQVYKTIYNQDTLRNIFYDNGFKIAINNKIQEYVYWQRSSSKAKTGSALFIKKEYLENVLSWARMGLPFVKDDLTLSFKIAELKAYESLALSNIEQRFNLTADEILIIDKKTVEVDSFASVSRYDSTENKVIVDDDKIIKLESVIWDGQCLVDESVFESIGRSDKGQILLRQRFFKACGFQTRLQAYIQKKKEEGIIGDTTKDMYGREVVTDKIKMVITEDCLKLYKFDDYIENKYPGEHNGLQRSVYEFWLDSLPKSNNCFGIVKSEKPSHYGKYQRMSYQMINSLNLSKEMLLELLKTDFDFIRLLKNDKDVLLKAMGVNAKQKDADFIDYMVAHNKDFCDTKLFINKKDSYIDSYINDLQRGYIKVRGGYCTLISNPYEMLQAVTGELDKFLMEDREVYTTMFKDGCELSLFRNPHILSGNCFAGINKYRPEFDWFNFSDEIIIISAATSDILMRMQGADLDSDNALVTDNSIILKHTKDTIKRFATPINQIKKESEKVRYYTNQDMAEVDQLLSNNSIGSVINTSCLLNSYYFHVFNENDFDGKDALLKDIYKLASLCSSLSQLEIDKAKKFIDIETEKVLDECTKKLVFYLDKEEKEIDKNSLSKKNYEKYTALKKQLTNTNDETLKKEINLKIKQLLNEKTTVNAMVVPNFFTNITSRTTIPVKELRLDGFTHFNCGMDNLLEVLNKENIPRKSTRSTEKKLSELMQLDNIIGRENGKHIDIIKEKIQECDGNIKKIRFLKKEERRNALTKKEYIDQCVDEITRKINPDSIKYETLVVIINQAMGERKDNKKAPSNDFSKMKQLVFTVIYKAFTVKMKELFKVYESDKKTTLIECSTFSSTLKLPIFNIFGLEYYKITKSKGKKVVNM